MGEEAAVNEQSPNWEASLELPLIQEGNGFHKGWPFNEGLPNYPWHGCRFRVVTAWGAQCDAVLDDEGVRGCNWIIFERSSIGRRVNKQQIAGWRRV